ncbi:hypothetical protein C8Q75DRAFT_735278 [Abortiporus biennis]|nr:hypothetical protein C8Q75DRAFT_735278 [Abortiporus biennis]
MSSESSDVAPPFKISPVHVVNMLKMLHRIPESKELVDDEDPDDDCWTECLVHSHIKEQLSAIPGFPLPLQRPSTRKYMIQPIEGKGLAMVATEDIDLGELILCERPLTLFSRLTDLRQYSIQKDVQFTKELSDQICLTDTETKLSMVFAMMHPKSRDQYVSLANSHQTDGSGPLTGRLRTNAFEAPFQDFGLYGETYSYAVVGHDISRCSHSCCPNADFNFDIPSFGMGLRASRLIPKGTEITVHYCDILDSYLDRQKALKPYCFACDCPSCKDPISSDNFRRILLDRLPNILNSKKTTLEEVLVWLKKIEDFKLQSVWGYIHCLKFVEKKYEQKGMMEEAKFYRNELYKHVLVKVGKQKVMQSLASLSLLY